MRWSLTANASGTHCWGKGLVLKGLLYDRTTSVGSGDQAVAGKAGGSLLELRPRRKCGGWRKRRRQQSGWRRGGVEERLGKGL